MSCSVLTSKMTYTHPLVNGGPIIDSAKYFCPYLEKGFCRDRTRCSFAHGYEKGTTKIPYGYCLFYLANQCLYGSECKFRHELPPLDNEHSDECNSIIDTFAQSSSSVAVPFEMIICEFCNQACLDPRDSDQQRQHREDCVKDHEREMELSFAIQRSQDKFCGICMETIIDKEPITARRFGILEGCIHTFCLDCIRTWRGSKQFDSKTTRSCPECRIPSNFVVPSKYWVEETDDKKKLIIAYKDALKSKPCKYFNQGKGECPFAGYCFYKHAYPDGRLAVLGMPKKKKIAINGTVPSFTMLLNLIGADEIYHESFYSDEFDWSSLLDRLPPFYYSDDDEEEDEDGFDITDDDDDDEEDNDLDEDVDEIQNYYLDIDQLFD